MFSSSVPPYFSKQQLSLLNHNNNNNKKLERQNSWSSDVVMLGNSNDADEFLGVPSDYPFHRRRRNNVDEQRSSSSSVEDDNDNDNDELEEEEEDPLRMIHRVISHDNNQESAEEDIDPYQDEFFDYRSRWWLMNDFDDDNDDDNDNDQYNIDIDIEDTTTTTTTTNASPIARMRIMQQQSSSSSSLMDDNNDHHESSSVTASASSSTAVRRRRRSDDDDCNNYSKVHTIPVSPPPPPPPPPPRSQKRYSKRQYQDDTTLLLLCASSASSEESSSRVNNGMHTFRTSPPPTATPMATPTPTATATQSRYQQDAAEEDNKPPLLCASSASSEESASSRIDDNRMHKLLVSPQSQSPLPSPLPSPLRQQERYEKQDNENQPLLLSASTTSGSSSSSSSEGPFNTASSDEDEIKHVFSVYMDMIQQRRGQQQGEESPSMVNIKKLMKQDPNIPDREVTIFWLGVQVLQEQQKQEQVQQELSKSSSANKDCVCVEVVDNIVDRNVVTTTTTTTTTDRSSSDKNEEEEKKDDDFSNQPEGEGDNEATTTTEKEVPQQQQQPQQQIHQIDESNTTTKDNEEVAMVRTHHASRRRTLFDQKLSMMMSLMKDNKNKSLLFQDHDAADETRTAVSVMSTMSCRELSIQRLQRRLAARIQRKHITTTSAATTAQQQDNVDSTPLQPEDSQQQQQQHSKNNKNSSSSSDKSKICNDPEESTMQRVQQLLDDLQEAQTRQKRLEQQLNQAGIAIADDVPYAVAKEQVLKIAQQMQVIGDSQVTHSDPKVQAKLRQEYYILEQQMEKFTRALELTDEYLLEQEQIQQTWEDDNATTNHLALQHILKHMPVSIRQRSIKEWLETRTPSGHYLPKPFLLKFSRTNVLTLLRMDPQLIEHAHPSNLEQRRVTGLTLTERRALHAYLHPIAARWKQKAKKDPLTNRKWNWYWSMRQTLQDYQLSYEHHLAQHGGVDVDVDVHGGNGDDDCCTCSNPRCLVRMNKKLDYFFQDYGYPCDLKNPQYETMACEYQKAKQQQQPQQPEMDYTPHNDSELPETAMNNDVASSETDRTVNNMKVKVKQRIERNETKRRVDPITTKSNSLMEEIAKRGKKKSSSPQSLLLAELASRQQAHAK